MRAGGLDAKKYSQAGGGNWMSGAQKNLRQHS